MTRTTTWIVLPAALLAVAAPPAPAASITRACGTLTVTLTTGGKGTAKGIRATGVGCRRARKVARACVRDTLRGWRISTAPSPDDTDPAGLTVLDRGRMHVSFQIGRRGGCA